MPGRLKWNDPVVKYLPNFRMYEPWVTQQMQVRDLLIHKSGLGAGAGDPMLWPDPNLFTRTVVIHGLRYLKPAYSFRSRYAYDNTLYIVAGEIAGAAGGAAYETLVRRELFGPLGMRRCQVGAWNRGEVGNVAKPHVWRDGRNVVVCADEAEIPNVPMMAAGGIRCLDDMLSRVRMCCSRSSAAWSPASPGSCRRSVMRYGPRGRSCRWARACANGTAATIRTACGSGTTGTVRG